MPHDDRRLPASRVPADLGALVRACWPAGPHDRLESVALPWLRAWGPVRAGASLPACSCRPGPCAICN